MKKHILIALAAASTLTVAAGSAMAQPRYDDRNDNRNYNARAYDDRYEDRYDFNRRMDASDRLQRRIERAVQNRRVTQSEARNLRSQVREIERIERDYWRDGRLSDRERRDLQHRVEIAEQWLRHERRDGDNNYNNNNGYRR